MVLQEKLTERPSLGWVVFKLRIEKVMNGKRHWMLSWILVQEITVGMYREELSWILNDVHDC